MKAESNAHQRVSDHCLGATFIEFTIILPLLLLVIFFFFEMGRYMFLYSAMNAGADNAVQFATKVAGFEKDPSDEEHMEARAATVARAEQAALLAFAQGQSSDSAQLKSAEVILPQATATRSLDDAFAQDPIQIVLEASVTPILPFFPSLPIRVVAEGYRERPKVASLPIPVDCNGNPQGSADYKAWACPCPPDEFYDWNTLACVCKFPYGSTGDCGCPEPTLTVNNGYSCTCPDAATLGCGPNQQRKETWSADGTEITCSCACNPGFIQTGINTCGCPEGYIESNGTCVCANSCSDGQVADAEKNCNCQCPSGSVTLGNGQCGCANSNFSFDTSTGSCSCSLTAADCTHGDIFDVAQCACVCPSPTVRNASGDCVCPAPKVPGQLGGCECTPVTCPENMTMNPATCQCVCNTGFVAGGSGGGCACPTAKVQSGNSCVCPTDPCGPNQVRNASTCLCQCVSGFVSNGTNSCGCAAGKTQSGNKCVCSNPGACALPHVQNASTCGCVCPSTACTGGTFNSSTCHCQCPEGKSFSGGKCQCTAVTCPNNATQNANTCSCSCNAGFTNYDGACVTNTCYQMLLSDPSCSATASGSCTCSEG